MKRCVSMLVAALAAFACLALPASAQVPGGLWRFGTTGAYAPQAGDCVSILAMNSSGQTGTDSSVPCSPVYLSAAYTNATTAYTAVLTMPTTQASTAVHGECDLTWESSSTSGTVTFGVGLSATPTDLWVSAVPADGAYVAPSYTTITSVTTTAVTGALVTTADTTPYKVHLYFLLANSSTAANTLTVYAESNNASYTASILAGSSCYWVP